MTNVTLADLLADVEARLAESRRQVLRALAKEYGMGLTLHFALALLAGATRRERRLARLFLRELDKLEQGEA
ncbi:MAG: hypothetical protein AB1505_12255 [Candidatus Latescibacterota bacterium]